MLTFLLTDDGILNFYMYRTVTAHRLLACIEHGRSNVLLPKETNNFYIKQCRGTSEVINSNVSYAEKTKEKPIFEKRSRNGLNRKVMEERLNVD